MNILFLIIQQYLIVSNFVRKVFPELSRYEFGFCLITAYLLIFWIPKLPVIADSKSFSFTYNLFNLFTRCWTPDCKYKSISGEIQLLHFFFFFLSQRYCILTPVASSSGCNGRKFRKTLSIICFVNTCTSSGTDRHNWWSLLSEISAHAVTSREKLCLKSWI